MLEQEAHHLDVARQRRANERRLSIEVDPRAVELHQPVHRHGVGPEIGIGALLEQRLDQIQRVAAVAVQERVLVVIEVAQIDRRKERRAVVVVGGIRVGAPLEQLASPAST